jgi:hypothetical protein
MRVAITGGRNRTPTHEEMEVFWRIFHRLCVSELLHGNARGTDQYVAGVVTNWKDDEHVIRVDIDHSVDGPWPAAGCHRNGRMLRMGAGDKKTVEALIAFPGGSGTTDCVNQARALGIPVYFAGERVQT